jgi:hypothetical protein
VAANSTTTVTEFQGAGNSRLCGVDTSPPSALSASNLGAGTAVVSVGSSPSVLVTFRNCAQAPPPSGQLTVCKQADPQLLATFFHPATVFRLFAGAQSFSLTGGNCVTLTLPAGNTSVSESSGANFALCGVTTSPSSALSGTNLAGGQAFVNVTSNSNTLVTFRNCYVPPPPLPTGELQVCKLARGGGPSDVFRFAAAGRGFSLSSGQCTTITLTPGPVHIVEAPNVGWGVCSISVDPPERSIATNGPARTADVNVVTATLTTVTFRNCLDPVAVPLAEETAPVLAPVAESQAPPAPTAEPLPVAQATSVQETRPTPDPVERTVVEEVRNRAEARSRAPLAPVARR